MRADEQLMTAVAHGDQRALAELLRRWEWPLQQFIARHTGGRDVDDLFQETWLKIVRAAPRFDPQRRFSTWLFQVAVNTCRDWHRRRPPEPAEVVDGAAPGGDPAEGVAAALDADRLLAALPADQRAVVLLRYYHDLGEAEVAEVLGCPRGTVKSRLHHAIARLARLARGGEPS
jgi:RNA polymerase sigma-70 factor (ECF subfamily)